VIDYEVVQRELLAAVHDLPEIDAATADALGLVTTVDVVADEPVPRFANSAMDGFAVRSADVTAASEAAPVTLVVVDEIPAGTAPTIAVGTGEAAAIMTGAPIPEGADAVVMVERTEREGDQVLVAAAVAADDNVRHPGDDVRPGDVLIPAGTVLTAAHIGVLANVGAATVRVRRRARVGVLSTGSELVGPGVELTPGKIRNSNGPMLLARIAESGFEPVDLGSVVDEEDVLTRAIGAAAEQCDALVMTGGVSVGTYDYVAAALQSLGELRAFKVAIKPAKPFAFGLVRSATGEPRPAFGLPGNPVSAFVSFELFAAPAIRRMMGHPQPFRATMGAEAVDGLSRRPDGKVHFLRSVATIEGDRWVVRSSGGQHSHMLSVLGRANALAIVPDGTGVEPGDRVDVMLL
jgi:molybdenum cofactor synthesis domain-containing protein